MEDGGSVYYHRCLVDIHRRGVLDKLLENVPRVPIGAMTTLATSGTCTYILISNIFQCLLTVAAGFALRARHPLFVGDYVDDPPFGANWTVVYDRDNCVVHSVDGRSYTNLTEAQDACFEAGSACGAVGAVRCNADGPFSLCSTAWRAIHARDFSCHGVLDDDSDWVLDTTDPYPAWATYKMNGATYWIFPSGPVQLSYLVSMSFALSYAVAGLCAVSFVRSSFLKFQAIPKDDDDSTNAAMAELVFLEFEIIRPINENWGAPITFFMFAAFIKCLYCESSMR
jgi:hypothetical protein